MGVHVQWIDNADEEEGDNILIQVELQLLD